jgi:hypothetical protein
VATAADRAEARALMALLPRERIGRIAKLYELAEL